MTLQEEKQQVDECERQVIGAYNNLIDAARSMGDSATKAAKKRAVRLYMLAAIPIFLGIFFAFMGAGILSGMSIGGGLVAVFLVFTMDREKEEVDGWVAGLNNCLDEYSKI